MIPLMYDILSMLMSREVYIVQEYSTFRDLIIGRAAPYSLDGVDNIVNLWQRLTDDDYHNNLQAVVFEDRFGGTLAFHRTEGGIRATLTSRPSIYTRIKLYVSRIINRIRRVV